MDCDGHRENALTRDELLDNVMMYWVNRSAASSARLYWESADFLRAVARVDLPTGIASYPKEIIRFPYRWCEEHYNIARWSRMTRGGHFAAFEQPELFVEDLRAFFRLV